MSGDTIEAAGTSAEPTAARPGSAEQTAARSTSLEPMAARSGDHTFLFADLVGFTALAELEGDDRALEVVLLLQRRVRDLLPQHGAEQVKAIGDGLMLRCMRPQAAIQLGLQLVAEMASDPDFPLLRVGIHTGPALSNDGDWYGRTVNVAARLCAVAPGGEVMVSEATRRAAGEIVGIEWGERELHWLRNVSEPVSTYIVCRREPHADTARSEPRWHLRLPWRLTCPMTAAREATA